MTCEIDWDEYDVGGTGKDTVHGKVKWNRVVEETRVSNLMLGVGAVGAMGAMVGGWVFRKSLMRLT